MHFAAQDDPFPVDVGLGPADRFLTLVTTDGGDPYKIESDWVVLGDPQLDLAETVPAPSRDSSRLKEANMGP